MKLSGDLSSRLKGLSDSDEGQPIRVSVRTDSVSQAPTQPSLAPEILNLNTASIAQSDAPTIRNGSVSLDDAIAEIREVKQDETEVQDDGLKQAFVGKPPTWKTKVAKIFWSWWHNKKARYGSLAGLIVCMALLGIIPQVRYGVLGAVGFNGSVSVDILDDTNGEPLKNVDVSIASLHAKTDANGRAVIKDAPLGSQTLTVAKRAFAKQEKTIVVGIGTSSIEPIKIRATGEQYTFSITNYVSGKPVPIAEAVSGDANANANKQGQIVLTSNESDAATLRVLISAKGFRPERLTIRADDKSRKTIKLVPAQKTVFVSAERGTFDVYSSYVDGKDKQLILTGTGSERKETLAISVNSEGTMAALVSSRDNKRNKDGYLLDALTLLHIENKTESTIENAEQIQIIGWSGNSILYSRTVAGASAGNPNRNRIVSYDFNKLERLQLASANSFVGTILIKNVLYFATNSTDPATKPMFAKIQIDGSSKQTISQRQLWSLARQSYTSLLLQTPEEWLGYTIGSSTQPTKTNIPGQSINRVYVDRVDGAKSVWADERDGKVKLIVRDNKTGKEQIIKSDEGIAYPIRWLNNDMITYHVTSQSQSAQYVISSSGGSAKKVSDVTATRSLR